MRWWRGSKCWGTTPPPDPHPAGGEGDNFSSRALLLASPGEAILTPLFLGGEGMARWATLRDEREGVAGAQPCAGGIGGVSPQTFPFTTGAEQRGSDAQPVARPKSVFSWERIFMGGEGEP